MSKITVIGNVTIDHFLSLSDEYVDTYCDIKDHECQIVLPYGEKVPIKDTEVHCGGNAANISVGLKRLGEDLHAIIPLGSDTFSMIAMGVLGKEGVVVDYVDDKNVCNSSFILRYKNERTILSHHEPKKYDIPEKFTTPYIYYSSHDDDNTVLSTKILGASHASDSKIIFAPSNSQIKGDRDILRALVENSYLLICNKIEAYEILSKVDSAGDLDIVKMLHRFNHLGAYHVVITDGANGVNFFDGFNQSTNHLNSVVNPLEILDTTGAGDAMCTGIIYALLNRLDLEDGVKLGLKNSASVLKYIGAQRGLLRRDDVRFM